MSGLPRVGVGFDIHPFADDPDRPLVLGGVRLPGPGLSGHSDADVVAHAVADALLGACGMADLGTRFPASDPTLAGADSMGLLADVMASVRADWDVGNVDVTVVAEVPRLAPHLDAVQGALRAVVGADVSVKPKRAEGLGALGRCEGIACFAVAIVGLRS